MKKIYIAGRVSGDSDYRQKFGRAAALLTEWGYSVLNPAVLPAALSDAEAMRICLAMIDAADIVALLPDWKVSKGAQLEYQYCCYTGKPAVLLVELANYTSACKKIPWEAD